MGGREVGGLANQLAAHMNFTPPDIDRVRRFWKAPRIATHEGLKAVQMFEAIARGEIKALWVIGTNPAVSLPDADGVREALKKLELFVVSENVRSNDTVNSGAHVLLPALAWGEKSGTVTNSERRISRQRAFLPAPGEARPDWWIVSEVAKRLGFGAAFDYKSAADVFREHAALSAFENDGSRDFDIGALTGGVRRRLRHHGAGAVAAARRARSRRRASSPRAASTPAIARRASSRPRFRRCAPRPIRGRPLRLNTGRVRDQWHTMTRTGLSPRLGAHLPEPYVEIHPDDAGRYRRERRQLCARHHRLRPVHPEGRRQRAAAARHAVRADPLEREQCIERAGRRAGRALHRSVLRPAREQVDAGLDRALRICVPRLRAVAQANSQLPPSLWWARAAVNGGYGYLFADNADLARWPSWLRAAAGGDIAEYRDFGGGVYRAASFVGDRIETCLFVGPAHDAGDWDVVKHLFAAETLTDDERRMLLSGRSTEGVVSAGPIVCACFGVGRAAICDAIAARREHRGRDRRAAEGRHQLRLLHSGAEAADRAGAAAGRCRSIERVAG